MQAVDYIKQCCWIRYTESRKAFLSLIGGYKGPSTCRNSIGRHWLVQCVLCIPASKPGVKDNIHKLCPAWGTHQVLVAIWRFIPTNTSAYTISILVSVILLSYFQSDFVFCQMPTKIFNCVTVYDSPQPCKKYHLLKWICHNSLQSTILSSACDVILVGYFWSSLVIYAAVPLRNSLLQAYTNGKKINLSDMSLKKKKRWPLSRNLPKIMKQM